MDEALFSSRRDLLKASASAGIGALAYASAVAAQSASPAQQRTPNGEPELAAMNQRRTLGAGTAGMEVSSLGFGVMGMNYNRGPHPDRKAMIALLHQAVESGVTLFDTAQVYGPLINEELAGEVLHPYRNRVSVTTKFGHKIINGKYLEGELDSRPATIRRVAEESLKRLRVDAIDLFYQHRADPDVPVEDVAGAVGELIRQGKVKRFGLCEVGPETIRRAHAVQTVTAVQSEYHLMWREQERAVFPVLAELGIGFVAYSPINRGFLSGAINEYTRFDSSNDNRAVLPRFTPAAIRANLAIVATLDRFGKTRGYTSAQVALAWLLAKAPWIVPIPGTTKLAHLNENLLTVNLTLTQDEVRELETAVSAIRVVGDRYPASQQKQVQS